MRYYVRMPFSDYREQLRDMGFRPEGLQALENYIDFLWESNQELNLVSRQMSFQELMENHVIDCCLPLKFFPKDSKVMADFGSGGGLPGVIYAIHNPQMKMVLFEKSALKQDFLKRCIKYAPNIEVRSEISPRLPNIEVVTSRAFKSLEIILTMSRDFYNNGGKYFLLKARREKIDEDVMASIKKFSDLEVKITKLQSPLLDVERHLVEVQKKSTSKQSGKQ